jgi:hypothetical protein
MMPDAIIPGFPPFRLIGETRDVNIPDKLHHSRPEKCSTVMDLYTFG